ncbi:hypothetical protein [Halopseudomonas salina]|uniref:Uncharacterized protein n=1 Tax=Halopseudomonas salina TaxID=1323744 RepID=A0ABQ1P1P0_9GAMM|nr:hypothetical protein [Halopseudomonas salina]GGC89320.1 hypothetical protein GCM10007418_06280 [Halopseudomonas salina]
MYSDWDDAPDRIRRRRGDKPPRIALWFMVMAVLAAGVAYAAFKPTPPQTTVQTATAPSAASIDTRQTRLVNPPPVTTQQTSAPQASIEWTDDDYDRQVEQMYRDSLDENAEAPLNSKQTVFNDSNYVPATQVNTIAMRKPIAYEAPKEEGKIHFGGIKHETPTCYAPAGSIECRRFKALMKKAHNRLCHSSSNWNSPACRRAAAYNPAE